ncbi:Uma2 family endonuclease [Actinoplanes sp. NPDC049265]|uniref:Uma2 family endonuclease n=1 Tax=Actinoplanes sp. NPDC049265 TaxID=3363902 RepID=UPI0037248B6F
MTTVARWTAPEGPWTEPDLRLFPQDGHRYEIVDGSLHVTPPLDQPHEAIVQAVITTLRGAAPEGWWVCPRLGLAFGPHRLIPDVTVLRPDSSGTVWATPTDVALVIEVEDPTSARYDRLLKPSLYAEAAIPHFWRISSGPTVHTHTLTNQGYDLQQSVTPPNLVQLTDPYPVRLAPSTWT